MPLCMKNLHTALNRERKLRHWGRLQYGLFLKGAGLGVDDAMAFWQVKRLFVPALSTLCTNCVVLIKIPGERTLKRVQCLSLGVFHFSAVAQCARVC